MHTHHDIAVIGAGPAGLAIASECAKLGLTVCVCDPTLDEPWPNRYAAWVDELHRYNLPIKRAWQTTKVRSNGTEQRFDRAYGVIDRTELKGRLIHLLREANATLIKGRATHISDGSSFYKVGVFGERSIRATEIIDATGTGMFTRAPGQDPALQTAFGWLLEVEHGLNPNEAVFMDFSSPDGSDRPANNTPVSFLYALPSGQNRLFVEETSLAHTPSVPLDLLQRRLVQRLERMGISNYKIIDTERCSFVMNAAPVVEGPIFAIGAAAGWVHPATGYQVVRAFAQAEQIAHALVQYLGNRHAGSRAKVWRAIWPTSHRRTRALHDLGLDLLLSMRPTDTVAFFQRFFAIPQAHWSAYLDATAAPSAIALAMARVFTGLPMSARSQILRHAMGRGPEHLAHAAGLRLSVNGSPAHE